MIRHANLPVCDLASCQFPVSDNISQNAGWIIMQMIEAADSGAMLTHFPECALSGYPGVDMESLEGFDWPALRFWTDSIMHSCRSRWICG